MTKISYFQRYSKRENHVTNNTLLLMMYFYQASPVKLNEVLSKLAGDDLSVGLIFEQQVKGTHSVLDGLISQLPLEVYFETKREGQLYKLQLENHIESISNKREFKTNKVTSILFGLTKKPIDNELFESIERKAKSKNILFQSITYEQIIQSLREVCEDHESALYEILSDYESYLESEGLIQIGQIMTVFPCGNSKEENIKHRLYFEPKDRLSKVDSDFVGFYKDKRVSHLGSTNTIVVGTVEPPDFKCEATEKGKLSQEEVERILGAIRDCSYYPDLGKDSHRYYLLDEIFPTEFAKSSDYGMMNRRDFYLYRWLNYENNQVYSAHEVAEQLRNKTWE